MPFLEMNPGQIYWESDDFSDPWKQSKTFYMQSGFCRNGNFWRGWVPHLARDFRVIRADLRGCGRSPDPGKEYQYKIDGLVDDFLNVRRQLELDPVHYVGESLGGIVGTIAAIKEPAAFASLTLVSTPLKIRDEGQKLESLEFSSWQEALTELGLEKWWLRVRREVFTGQTPDDARDTYFARELARTSVRVAVELSLMVHGFNLEPYLSMLNVPTLVLIPLNSKLSPQLDQESLGDGIPGATIVTYPGATHDIYYLKPDELAEETLRFVTGLK